MDSADSRVGQGTGPTDTHIGIGEGHSAWALGSTSVRGRHRHMASPTSGPDLHPLASGPASVTPRSAVGPFSQSTFLQMPGGVGALLPQDGLGGAAPPPSATANGLFGLEAPEISAAPSTPRRGPCSAPWLFLS